jgi:DNA modification methylase
MVSVIEFGNTGIGCLRPDIRNARSHSNKQIAQIAASIAENGFVNPILINPEHLIIAGHGRFRAAKQLGLSTVPTITIKGLSDAQERRLRLADNKIAQNASWDMDLVKIELAAIETAGLDLALTGFSVGEIDVLRSINFEPELSIASLPQDPVTQSGDIWICGEHRVGCGDLLDGTSLRRLMNGAQADAVICDPPYNVKIAGHAGGNGRIKHREFSQASGEMSVPQFTEFLEKTLGAMASVSRDGAIHFVCMDHHHADELISAGSRVYGKRLNIVVWVKSNAGMGAMYRSKHELVFVFRVGEASHLNNIELGKHGRNRTNVWEYSSVNTFGARSEDLALHPTVKPTPLYADAIKDVTKRGDIVLDGFLGSGTLILAATHTRRRAFGLEIDPAYVDVALGRWMALTGEEPILERTGQKFSEIARQTALEAIDG